MGQRTGSRFPLLVALVSVFAVSVRAQNCLPAPEAVYEAMRRANDYWIANFGLGNAAWDTAAYYTGNQYAFRLLGEPAYLRRALDWAEANRWRIGPETPQGPDSYHADAHCCGQTYLDLYRLDPQPVRAADIRQTMDAILATAATDDDWWWIDAFYMAAPTLARLGRLTGDTNYFHKLWLMYDDMASRRGLYDPAAGLFYRDGAYVYPARQTSGGNKVFWSRGNGWLIAGLARVLEQMPAVAPQRPALEDRFRTLAAALKDLQAVHGTDGMWRASLHEPSDYGGTPETSGTAFITYGMAWGVRSGLLDAAAYTNPIARAWQGLTNIALSAEGRLGYVQAIGAAPNDVDPDDTASYGVGAFLLAGAEIALLDPASPSVSPWAGPDEEIGDLGKDGQEAVGLDASATEVYRGAATEYTWWTNGQAIATGLTAHVRLPLGAHPITLRVAHSDGRTYTGQVTKTVVTLPDVIPDAGPDQVVWDADRDAVETVVLDASGTRVTFGEVTALDWWLGDVWLGAGSNVSARLPLGRHAITLKAVSSEGPEYTDEVVKFIVPGVSVAASAVPQPENPPAATIDGDLGTRWSAQGDGQWIRYDMGRTNAVAAVHIAFYVGNSRMSQFSLESSLDGTNWFPVLSRVDSSGLTLERERFAFPSLIEARYIRIVGHGNSSSAWNSYTEVALEAAPAMADADADALPDAWEMHQLGGLAGTFQNPLNAGADPWLQYQAGDYYLATTQGNAIRMWKAPTLGGLKTAAPVTVWTDEDPSRSRGMWAPEFHRIGDRWYLYYTATSADNRDDNHRMHVLESAGADPLGPYTYKGRLADPANDQYAIDGSVFRHPGDGYWYFLWAARPGHVLTIARLGNPWTLAGPGVVLPAAGFGCEEVREGPVVLHRNGWLFLVYSACDTGKPDYKLGMLVADEQADVLDPAAWQQHPEPVFERNDPAGVFGPGHNGFFRSPDGTEDWIVYHAKTTSAYTYRGRTTRAQPFAWNPDGTPNFGRPLPLETVLNEPSGTRLPAP